MRSSLYRQVLVDVERASTRAAARAHADLHRGIHSLATIAAIAPLFGFGLTLFRIDNSFGPLGTSASIGRALVAQGLSESLAPALLGLLVGTVAYWFHRYLSGQMESFDLEMRNASTDLLNRLAVHLGRLAQRIAEAPQAPAPVPSEQAAPEAVRECPVGGVPSLPLEGPRLSLAMWDDRRRLRDVLWPELRTDFDADSILCGGLLISFGFALLGWLVCYWQGGLRASLMTLAFFAVAGVAIRMGSRLAVAGVIVFFPIACAACVVANGWSFESVCLAAAPLLLVNSLRAAWFLAALDPPSELMTAAAAWRPSGFKRIWPVLRRLPQLLVAPLWCCECAVVLFGTVLTFYSADADWSMEPAVQESDWVVSVNAPLMGEIRRGDFVALEQEWYPLALAATRVVGFPGDLIHMSSGTLIRNGQPVGGIRTSHAGRMTQGALPISFGSDPYGSERWEFESTNAFLVPEGTYFVLTDGINGLFASRVGLMVAKHDAVGKPILAYSPWTKPWRLPRRIH